MVVSKLKAFMFCTLLVAMASLVVMFYYSVTFSQYSKIGIRYVEMLKTEYFATREMPRGVREKNLNNTALSHVSTYSNASRRHVDLRESLRSNKLHDVIGILNENNSSPKEDLIEKPKTEVAGNNPAQTKPTTSTSESQQRKELNLCSAGSKQGKRFLFVYFRLPLVCLLLRLAGDEFTRPIPYILAHVPPLR